MEKNMEKEKEKEKEVGEMEKDMEVETEAERMGESQKLPWLKVCCRNKSNSCLYPIFIFSLYCSFCFFRRSEFKKERYSNYLMK
jgi:hypothetical protein